MAIGFDFLLNGQIESCHAPGLTYKLMIQCDDGTRVAAVNLQKGLEIEYDRSYR